MNNPNIVQNIQNSELTLVTSPNANSLIDSDFFNAPNNSGSKKRESFFPNCGNAMTPLYQPGEIMMCREFIDWRMYVLYGEAYLIVTEQYQMVRFVKKSANDDTFLLSACNSHFEDFEIPKYLILKMFLITGSINRSVL